MPDSKLHDHSLTLKRKGSSEPLTLRVFRDHDSHMAARKAGGRYGASSVAALLGLDEYCTPWELWARLRGIAPDIEDNEAMEAGRRSEPWNCEWYADKIELKPGQHMLHGNKGGLMIDHPTDPLAACSPDLVVLGGIESVSVVGNTGAFELHGEPCIEWGADAKNHSHFMRRRPEAGKGYGDEWTDDVPKPIWHQLQWTLYVTGLPFWDVSAIFGGQKHRIFRVHAHPCVQRHVADRVHEFHEQFIIGNGEPPMSVDQLAELDKRLTDIYRHDAGDTIEVLGADLDLVRQYAMVRSARERLEHAESAISGALKARMESAQKLVLPGAGAKGADLVIVSWKTNRQSEPKRDDGAYAAELELLLRRLVRAHEPESLDRLEQEMQAASDRYTPTEGRKPARPFKVSCKGDIAKLNELLAAASGRVDGAPAPVLIDDERGDQPVNIYLPDALLDNRELLARALGHANPEGSP